MTITQARYNTEAKARTEARRRSTLASKTCGEPCAYTVVAVVDAYVVEQTRGPGSFLFISGRKVTTFEAGKETEQ